MNGREPDGEDARPYRGEYEGRITGFFWPVSTWILTNLIVAPLVLLFFGVLNRTRIYGRGRVPHHPNTLLLGNHQSMIDSFPIGYAAFFPYDMVKPYLIPWNPAAEENFFRNRFFAWLFHQFKCIPVRPGRRDVKALHRSARALRGGTMILFPEGTRSRDGSIGRGRPGAGFLALETGAAVVPVTIDGMDRVLPVGSRLPRIGQRISVYFGHPIEVGDLAGRPPTRQVAQQLVDRAMERIRFQRRVVARIEGREPASGQRGEGSA